MELYKLLITFMLIPCMADSQGSVGVGSDTGPKGTSKCRGEVANLACPANHHIHVLQVFYGRSTSRGCQFDSATSDQCLREDLSYHPCTGQRICQWLIPQRSLIGCGPSTYATITFNCLPTSDFKHICDRNQHIVSKDSGYLVSPGYPGNFPLLKKPCHVIISLSAQQAGVQFFVYDLDLGEGGAVGGGCRNYVEIRLSLVTGSERSVKICSNTTLHRNQLVTQAEASLARVSFHVESTDHTHSGFLIYYKGLINFQATNKRFSTTPFSIMRPTTRSALAALTLATTTTVRAATALTTPPTPNYKSNFLLITTTTAEGATDVATGTETTAKTVKNGSIFSQEKTRYSEPWAAIAGGVIASIAGVLLLAIIGIMIWEKRKKKSARTRIYDDVVFGERGQEPEPTPAKPTQEPSRGMVHGKSPLSSPHLVYENVHVNGGFETDILCSRPEPPCGYGNNRRPRGALFLKPGALPPPPPPGRDRVYQNAEVKLNGHVTPRLPCSGRPDRRSHNYDEVAFDHLHSNMHMTKPTPKKRESLGTPQSCPVGEEGIYCDVDDTAPPTHPIPLRTASKQYLHQKPDKPPLKPKPKSPAHFNLKDGNRFIRSKQTRESTTAGDRMTSAVRMVDNEVYETEEYIPS